MENVNCMKNIQILKDVLEVEAKRYVSFGDFSVSDLINPVRYTALNKRHKDEVERDPQSLIGALIGTGIHELFENRLKIAATYNPKYVLERTVQDIMHVNDTEVLITGRFDILYDLKHITDIKSCSTWKKIFSPGFEDWTLQQNLYAYLLHRRGVDVESINILAVYKDWSEGSAFRDRSYPQTQIEEIRLDLWPFDITGQILERLVEEHVYARTKDDADLPECPPADRWERFPGGGTKQYAIMTGPKAKRADKVFTSQLDEVFEYVQMRQAGQIAKKKPLPKTAFIEVRHAQRKRCEKYCAYNMFCNHYKEYMNKKTNNNLNERIELSVML
jgi:hypothetical protein